MKAAGLLLLVCVFAAGQAPPVKIKTIAFDRADAKHCKTAMIEGRAMREIAFGGTSVAVGDSVGTGDGYFRVFVLVRHFGPGKTEVKPRQFSALYSDPANTRFSFYDKGAEISQRRREEIRALQAGGTDVLGTPSRPGSSGPTQTVGSSRAAKLGRMRKPDPNEAAGREEVATRQDQATSGAGTVVTPDQLYLSRATLHQGTSAEGFVYFKKPRRSKLHVGLSDPLHEIDIPVGGVVFRFNEAGNQETRNQGKGMQN